MNVAAVADGSAVNRFASLAIDALRGIRWPQIRAAMLLGLALTAWGWTVFIQAIAEIAQTMPLGRMLLQALIDNQVKALCLLAAIVIADRAVDEGARRHRTYLLAALAGCVAGIAVTEPFNWFWRTYMLPDRWPAHYTWWHGTWRALYFSLVFFLSQWLLVGSAVVFLYADRRAARKTAQILRDAELDRIRRSRLALESRLQAMQARVEPQFLFDTLDQVEHLCDDDPTRAGTMLDPLIAYLRAAMPHMRDTSSTAGQEFILARAYLEIMRARFGDRLRVEAHCSDELEAARMPPMMLLPLIDNALAACVETNAMTIRVDVRAHADRLQASIIHSPGGSMPLDAMPLANIRERLSVLYGDNASLHIDEAAGCVEARLDVPLEFR